MRRNTALYLLLALSACASTETRKRELDERVTKRIGGSVETLIQAEGPPERSMPKGPPGEFLYVYDWVDKYGNGHGGDCTATYVVKDGVVTAGSVKNCY